MLFRRIMRRLDALAVDQGNHASAILTALANQRTQLNTLKELKELIMALPTQADLDAAIATAVGAINTLGTDLAAGLAALEAKIAAAGTPIDLTTEIAALNDIAAKAQGMDASVLAANPPATPAP